nr:MAG TPA: hypothetical protein [Caudoviricetes sp.]
MILQIYALHSIIVVISKKDEVKTILISSFLCIIIGSGNDFHPRTPSAPHDITNRPAQSIQHVAQILFL